MKKFAILTMAVCALGFAMPEAGAIKVELKQVHMCCAGCATEVADELKKVAGVKDVVVIQEKNLAQLTAADNQAAQKAIDALELAGFHGASGSKNFAFKDDSGVKLGKVKTLSLTGFHNTCAGCVTAFRDALKGVPGITGDNLKAKVTTCELRGDFDAAAAIQALNNAGFHVKVKN